MENWKVKIIDKGYTLMQDVFIWRPLIGNRIELVSSNNTVEVIEDGAVKEPTLRLNNEQLIAFADALNNAGINPRKEFTEGKLEATEKHLEDMRKLVFSKTNQSVL